MLINFNTHDCLVCWECFVLNAQLKVVRSSAGFSLINDVLFTAVSSSTDSDLVPVPDHCPELQSVPL